MLWDSRWPTQICLRTCLMFWICRRRWVSRTSGRSHRPRGTGFPLGRSGRGHRSPNGAAGVTQEMDTGGSGERPSVGTMGPREQGEGLLGEPVDNRPEYSTGRREIPLLKRSRDDCFRPGSRETAKNGQRGRNSGPKIRLVKGGMVWSVSGPGPQWKRAQWKAGSLCQQDGTRQEPVTLGFLLLLPLRSGECPGAAPHFPPLFSAGPHSSLSSPFKPCSLVQVDSLSVTPGPLGVPELMVSQPGCAYATLLCTWSKDAGPAAASEGATEGSR